MDTIYAILALQNIFRNVHFRVYLGLFWVIDVTVNRNNFKTIYNHQRTSKRKKIQMT